MKLLEKIFSNGAKELTDSIGGAIDKLSTSDEEKLKAKSDLSNIVLSSLNKLSSYQRDVLVQELKGNWLQKSWRPILMLAFGFVVVYSKFIAPAFGLPNTTLELEFWNLLQIGIGGYVVGRSAEKIAQNVTENVDMTFLKKKDRK